MKLAYFVVLFILCSPGLNAQKANYRALKDSLFKAGLKYLPIERQVELEQCYDTSNGNVKDFLLLSCCYQHSSKKELIENIDNNSNNITLLKNEFGKLIPANHVVSIEYNPADSIWDQKESFNISIVKNTNGTKTFYQEWNLEPKGAKLKKVLKSLNWSNETLEKIKSLLKNANCISVDNDEIVTIGFARSGMGLYSFKLFKTALSPEEIIKFNDHCLYIFYKNNIVLEYGGGAVGNQCFPD